MTKWLSKGGLSAVFKDVVMMPYNYSKLLCNHENAVAKAFAVASQVIAGGTAGIFVANGGGLLAALTAFYASNHFFAALPMLIDGSQYKKYLWPNVTKFSNSLKPQSG